MAFRFLHRSLQDPLGKINLRTKECEGKTFTCYKCINKNVPKCRRISKNLTWKGREEFQRTKTPLDTVRSTTSCVWVDARRIAWFSHWWSGKKNEEARSKRFPIDCSDCQLRRALWALWNQYFDLKVGATKKKSEIWNCPNRGPASSLAESLFDDNS